METWVLDKIRRAKAERWRFLDLGKAGLTSLPPELFELEELEGLNLSIEYSDIETGERRDTENHGMMNYIALWPGEIARLKLLRMLSAGRQPCADLEPLGRLANLTWLYLNCSQVTDLAPLGRLANLTSLRLYCSQVTDFEPLGQLANLNSLDLSETPVTDMRPLAQLANLTSLNLSSTRVSDVTPLAQLANLTSLNLSSTRVSDVTPLAQLANLTSLDLRYTSVSDVRQLVQLANLTTLGLFLSDVTDLEPLGRLANLTSLYLHCSQVTDLAPLGRLANLTSLYRHCSQVTDLAPLGRLANLTSLYLHCSQVTDLAPLGRLANLTSLRFYSPQVTDFEPLRQLANLNSLDLSETLVTDLEPLGQLSNLTSLDLNYTKITNIEPLGQLANLVSLNLADTQVANIESLGRLVNLISLNLNSTKITNIEPLGQLANLTSLNLNSTKITNIEPLGRLANLTSLNLICTMIANIEPLGRLTNLISLDLMWTKITNIEPLGRLSNLTSLNVAHTKITNIEPLGRLANLTSLNLCATQVCDVEPLTRLANLTSLALRNTKVINVEPILRIANLTSLNGDDTRCFDANPLGGIANWTHLNLGGMPISDVEPLGQLANLISLDLSDTLVSDAEPLGQLANLISLDLSDTLVSDVEPLGRLANLTWLNLSHTEVSDPEPLARLANLETLSLGKCRLRKFPQFVLALPQLWSLCLYGNSLEDCPDEFLGCHQDYRYEDPANDSNCLPAVRAHFADLAAGTVEDRELKLILLGNGRVGKSSIAKRLIHDDFDPHEKSTHAIRLEEWTLDMVGGETRINVWDFGGQDIYHGTHALFLKSRAVFVIVWDRSTEQSPEYSADGLTFQHLPLAYWLDYVRAVSPQGTVIVVENKCDDGRGSPPPLELGELPAISFSAQTGHGREALLAFLKEATQRVLGQAAAHQIGIGRSAVKQTLRGYRREDEQRPPAERQHCRITRQQFDELCAQQGANISSADELLKFLHHSGVVYHEPELFHGDIILDQRWAIEAIYTLFNREKCYRQLLQKHGRFTLRDLHDLAWNEAGFSRDEQRLFLSFMQSCSICFPISKYRPGEDENKVEYLAPELLPKRETLQKEIELRTRLYDDVEPAIWFRYRHRFLHQGVMQRFLVSVDGLLRETALYWRDGVLLESSERRALAVIECHRRLGGNAARGEIVLHVRGPGRESLLKEFRKTLERLHIPGAEVEQHASLDGIEWVDANRDRIGDAIIQPDGRIEHSCAPS